VIYAEIVKQQRRSFRAKK